MNNLTDTLANKTILSVSQLNNAVKNMIESEFRQVWVEGEVSNFSAPGSGHWYFTLKDDAAQIRCAMFRNRNQALRFRPKQGDKFIARGQVSLYAARGDYQLIVENLTDSGAGALQRAFEELKSDLQQRGWFDPSSKRELPLFPRHIGVITSATGAVWHDIQTVFERRYPMLTLTLAPVAVQGADAAIQISQAFARLNKLHQSEPLDAIILARGGGSLEDLAAFNTLEVASAVHTSTVHVVCGIGHETDVSIADFVADKRAPTPTAAAELLCPDQRQLAQQLDARLAALQRGLGQKLAIARRQVDNLQARIKHPRTRIQEQYQRVDDLGQQLQRYMIRQQQQRQQQLNYLQQRLAKASPSVSISRHRLALANLNSSLLRNIKQQQRNKRSALVARVEPLQRVSPLATLQRGYTLVQRHDGRVLSKSADIKPHESVSIRFSDGSRKATIE